MIHSISWTSVFGLVAVACARATPGADPHDMSTAGHEQEAAVHSEAAEQHAAQYDPEATRRREHCRGPIGRFPEGANRCWTSVVNPTETHLRQAEEHRRHAADHRAASEALRAAEARACVGIHPDDRDMSPFEHVEDISSVEPLVERIGTETPPTPRNPGMAAAERTVGAIVTFRAVPGMTAEWFQRVVDCHLARNASLGHDVPEMPNCPLVPNGAAAQIRSTGNGFAVEIRSGDSATAADILARAERLRSMP